MTQEKKLEAIREVIEGLKGSDAADYTEVEAGLVEIERILDLPVEVEY